MGDYTIIGRAFKNITKCDQNQTDPNPLDDLPTPGIRSTRPDIEYNIDSFVSKFGKEAATLAFQATELSRVIDKDVCMNPSYSDNHTQRLISESGKRFEEDELACQALLAEAPAVGEPQDKRSRLRLSTAAAPLSSFSPPQPPLHPPAYPLHTGAKPGFCADFLCRDSLKRCLGCDGVPSLTLEADAKSSKAHASAVWKRFVDSATYSLGHTTWRNLAQLGSASLEGRLLAASDRKEQEEVAREWKRATQKWAPECFAAATVEPSPSPSSAPSPSPDEPTSGEPNDDGAMWE